MSKFCYSFVLLLLAVTTLLAGNKKQSRSEVQSPYDFSHTNFFIAAATPAQPTVFTNAATLITQTSAQLNSSVNPNDASTNAHFDWGTTASYGSTTTAQLVGSDNSFHSFPQTVSGLTPNTLYHFRVSATNSEGTTLGSDQTFTTKPNNPNVTTDAPTSIGLTSATLNGSANPNGAATTGKFEWGTTISYGNFTSSINLENGNSPVSFNQALTGLSQNTTYHYRAAATNAGGTTNGPDQQYTTLASPKEYLSDGSTVVLYHFNEASGTFVEDYSGNGRDGLASNSANIELGGGIFGNARSHNLTSDYTEIASSPAFNFGSNSFTLECWVEPALFNAGKLTLISKGNRSLGNLAYSLSVLSSSQLELRISSTGDSTGEYVATTVDSSIIDGVWHHVVAVVDFLNSEVRLYNNANLMATTTIGTFPANIFSTSAPVRIGLQISSIIAARIVSDVNAFHCSIDEVRISNKARAVDEFNSISSIHGQLFLDVNNNSVKEGDEPGLSGWTVFLSGTAQETTLTDGSGFYHFTNLGARTYTVGENLVSGWLQTHPIGGSYTIALPVLTDTSDIDFGNYAPAVSVNKGWNMVSLPVTITNGFKDSLFTHATSHAFSFTPLGYASQDTMRNSVGYWLKFPASEVVQMLGTGRMTDTFTVIVGWNMIGSITRPVPTSSITSDPPGLVTSNFYGYKSGYFIPDTVAPGKGYWVKVSQNGKLILTASSAIPSVNRIRIESLAELPPSPPEQSGMHLTSRIPAQFGLEQNYPNPFNPTTEIRYQISEVSYVRLKVYNLLGEVVATLVDGIQDAGYRSAEWDARGVASGLYVYKIEAIPQNEAEISKSFVQIRKMILMK